MVHILWLQSAAKLISKSEIRSLIMSHPLRVSGIVKKDRELLCLLEPIMLQYNTSIQGALYCYIHDFRPICDKQSFSRMSVGFVFCGNRKSCMCCQQSVSTKSKQTNLKKYGVINPGQSTVIKKKIKQAKKERYNDENYNNQTKAKETKLARYGDVNYNNRNKANETSIQRYNNKNYNNRDKAKRTKLARYGDVNYNNQAKAKATNGSKYTHEWASQEHISEESFCKLNDKDWLIEQHHTNKRSLTDIADELGINKTTVSIKMYNYEINVIHRSGQSMPEIDLIDYITYSHNTRIVTNSRAIIPPKEIDIYLPEYRLAIEYNGRYWHHPDRFESTIKWKEYHQAKIDLCYRKGIRLLYLWEGYGDHYSLIDNAILGNIQYDFGNIYEIT